MGAVAAGVLQGVGQVVNGVSGPISAGINAHMYKKYGLHEPEYLAASQRAAGINPLIADSGSLPAPPDLGFNMDFHPEGIISSANESKNMTLQAKILKENAEKAVNDNMSSFNNMRITGMNADLLNEWGPKIKAAELGLTNATAKKLGQEADLLSKKQSEAEAEKQLWDTLIKDPNIGGWAKGLTFIKGLLR